MIEERCESLASEVLLLARWSLGTTAGQNHWGVVALSNERNVLDLEEPGLDQGENISEKM